MERVKGIEPSCVAWKATVLPLNYTRETVADFEGAGGEKQFRTAGVNSVLRGEGTAATGDIEQVASAGPAQFCS